MDPLTKEIQTLKDKRVWMPFEPSHVHWNDKLGKPKTCYHCNQPWSASKTGGVGRDSKTDVADLGGLHGEELDIMVHFLSEGDLQAAQIMCSPCFAVGISK